MSETNSPRTVRVPDYDTVGVYGDAPKAYNDETTLDRCETCGRERGMNDCWWCDRRARRDDLPLCPDKNQHNWG